MDKHCGICHNTSCSNHGKNISFLGDGWKCNYIPVPTNADRIRAMSDYELAQMLATGKGTFTCLKCMEFIDGECSMKCDERCLEWLQQPAEGE